MHTSRLGSSPADRRKALVSFSTPPRSSLVVKRTRNLAQSVLTFFVQTDSADASLAFVGNLASLFAYALSVALHMLWMNGSSWSTIIMSPMLLLLSAGKIENFLLQQ